MVKASLEINFSALLTLTTITRNSIPQNASMTEEAIAFTLIQWYKSGSVWLLKSIGI